MRYQDRFGFNWARNEALRARLNTHKPPYVNIYDGGRIEVATCWYYSGHPFDVVPGDDYVHYIGYAFCRDLRAWRGFGDRRPHKVGRDKADDFDPRADCLLLARSP